MSPYFNQETGELADPDFYTDVPDPSAPTPAASTPSDTGPTITRERMVQETVAIAALAPEDALAEYDRLHAAQMKDPSLADERTEAGRAFQERKDALIMRGNGLALEDNRVIGTVHEGGRLRPVEAEIAGTYAESATVTADRPEQDALMTLGRDLGVPEFAADVRHGMLRIPERPTLSDLEAAKQYEAQWTLAERQRINEQLEELHEVTDRWLAKHGISAQRRERWAEQLVRVEERGKAGIDWLLNELWATLWQRDPGGFSNVYAEWAGGQYEAAQARAEKAWRGDEDDPERVVVRDARP